MMRAVAKRRLVGGDNRPDMSDIILPRENNKEITRTNEPNFCQYSNEKNSTDYSPLVDEYFSVKKRLEEIRRKLAFVGIDPETFQ